MKNINILPLHVALILLDKSKELAAEWCDGLSDIDMTTDGMFAVEYEGMYGKHWSYFATEQEREDYINKKRKDFMQTQDVNYYFLKAEWIAKRKASMHFKEATASNIGNLISSETAAILANIK